MSRNKMNQMNYLMMPLLIIWALSLSSNAQSRQPTLEELWISIPSSPLEIDFNSSRRYSMLHNRSLGIVVRYRLGCVSGLEDNKLRILRKTKPVDTKLEPDKVLLNSVSVHIDEMERCHKMNSQLAVIEVMFKDGSSWKAASH